MIYRPPLLSFVPKWWGCAWRHYGHSVYGSMMLASSWERAETSSLGASDELVCSLSWLTEMPENISSIVFYVVCLGVRSSSAQVVFFHRCAHAPLPQISLSFILQSCLMSYSFLSLVGRLLWLLEWERSRNQRLCVVRLWGKQCVCDSKRIWHTFWFTMLALENSYKDFSQSFPPW